MKADGAGGVFAAFGRGFVESALGRNRAGVDLSQSARQRGGAGGIAHHRRTNRADIDPVFFEKAHRKAGGLAHQSRQNMQTADRLRARTRSDALAAGVDALKNHRRFGTRFAQIVGLLLESPDGDIAVL